MRSLRSPAATLRPRHPLTLETFVSLSTLRTDLALPTDHLHVTPLHDPVVDLLGHDLRSSYVERFWLPILGPTTTLLLRHVAVRLDDHPDGFDLPLLDTAAALGLGNKAGRNSPFLRAVARATKFSVARAVGHGALAVRQRVAPLTRSQTERLPAPLRDEHDAWTAEAAQTPDVDSQRRRARRLALSLAELGEPDEAIERQLHRWKIHPAMAHEAMRWAHTRRHTPPTPPAATTAPAAASPPPTPTDSPAPPTSAAPATSPRPASSRRAGPPPPPPPGRRIGAVFAPDDPDPVREP